VHDKLMGSSSALRYFALFFFQEDDGIRFFHVAGVQTCALPISPPHRGVPRRWKHGGNTMNPHAKGKLDPVAAAVGAALLAGASRSEERRVGKECGESRWRVCTIS